MFSSSLHVPVSIHMLHFHLPVQPLPPQNLKVQNSSGDFFLTWTAAEGSQWLGNALEYEVTYKRDWESWEVRADELGCPDLGGTLQGS